VRVGDAGLDVSDDLFELNNPEPLLNSPQDFYFWQYFRTAWMCHW
jgi:hypothetical protein